MKIYRGKCTKCGSAEIEYQTAMWYNDDEIEYTAVCTDCGCEFAEYYEPRYIRTETEDE